MSDRVIVSKQDGVADVRMNRPDKLNALDQAMFEGLAATGRALAADKSLRAVVLSGEGRAFCAGLDFASFMGMAQSERPARSLLDRSESIANFAQQAAWVWTELPVPVIAAVHGVAFGGGLQVALGADIRIVAPDAQLSVMEIKWGLIPDMSGTQTLRHLVRLDVAKELTFTGRIVRGEEAVALGREQVPGCHPCRQEAAEQCQPGESGRRPAHGRNAAARAHRWPESDGGCAGQHAKARAAVHGPGRGLGSAGRRSGGRAKKLHAMAVAARKERRGFLTYRDLWHSPEDGNRYEIINGEVYVTPPPHTAHQAARKPARSGRRRVTPERTVADCRPASRRSLRAARQPRAAPGRCS
jgi:enoyl-CoA hydratase/carnithine racemase